MLLGIIVGLATAAGVVLISALLDPKALRPVPRTAADAFGIAAITAMFIGILFSHPLNYAFGNFLGIFLGYMAAQKLLIKKA